MRLSGFWRASAAALLCATCFYSVAAATEAPAPQSLSVIADCQGADEVIMVVDGQRTPMRYVVPQMRAAARAMGFGGFSQYAALPGPRATQRLANGAQPTFLVSAPSNMQPQGMFVLARLETRRNGTREISVGGGYMSYSTGVPADRQTPLNLEPAPSQSGAPAGTTIYRLTPASALAAGEYALIVSTGQQQGAATMMGPTVAGRFYDFGVD